MTHGTIKFQVFTVRSKYQIIKFYCFLFFSFIRERKDIRFIKKKFYSRFRTNQMENKLFVYFN